jgi:hypothetical protein
MEKGTILEKGVIDVPRNSNYVQYLYGGKEL